MTTMHFTKWVKTDKHFRGNLPHPQFFQSSHHPANISGDAPAYRS